MLFRVVSDHFSSVFLVADCIYLFQVFFSDVVCRSNVVQVF